MIVRNLLLFIGAVGTGFVYICNVIPQTRSEPVVAQPAIGGSPEDLAVAGKAIFTSDRAQCLTCHSLGEDPKARCPNQERLGERASQRRPGMGAAEYIVESLYNPNAYIVPGYPKNQMQPVNKPPIALTHDEILAVIAFLNTLGGQTDAEFIDRVGKAQEPWRRGLLKPEVAVDQYRPPILRGDPERGRVHFQEQGCIKCHRVGNEGRDAAPDLTSVGATQGPDYILESILNPTAVIVRGYQLTTVVWKQQSRLPVQGTPVAWLPDKEHPRTLRLSIVETDTAREVEIDLSEVSSIGDTVVGAVAGGGVKLLRGEHVEGEKKTGATLRLLEDGRWVERLIPPEQIDFVTLPISPMPENYAELMTPRATYDLLAFLSAQRGKK